MSNNGENPFKKYGNIYKEATESVDDEPSGRLLRKRCQTGRIELIPPDS